MAKLREEPTQPAKICGSPAYSSHSQTAEDKIDLFRKSIETVVASTLALAPAAVAPRTLSQYLSESEPV